MKNSIVESKNDQLEENKVNYHHRVNLHGGPTWGSYMVIQSVVLKLKTS